MANLTVNGAKPARVTLNGAAVKTVTVNGVVVWQSNVTATDLIDWAQGAMKLQSNVSRSREETPGEDINHNVGLGYQLGPTAAHVGYLYPGEVTWNVPMQQGHVYWYAFAGGCLGDSNGRLEVVMPWDTYTDWSDHAWFSRGAVQFSKASGNYNVTARYAGFISEARDGQYTKLYHMDLIDMTAAGLAWTDANLALLERNCQAMNGSKTLTL